MKKPFEEFLRKKTLVRVEVRAHTEPWTPLNSALEPTGVLFIELTWKTVSSDCQNVSKLLRGFSCVVAKLNRPPNSCMPRRAKMTMNRNNNNRRLAIDLTEFSREVTRFRNDDQYLQSRSLSHL